MPSSTYLCYEMFLLLVLMSCLVAVQLQSLPSNEIISKQFNSTLVTFQQSDYDTLRSDGFKVRSMVSCCTRCYQLGYQEVRSSYALFRKLDGTCICTMVTDWSSFPSGPVGLSRAALGIAIKKTIQRRISDSVDFDRDWNRYVNGFGDVGGNYWMGLEELHQLTTSHNLSLDIDIETFEGEPFTLKLETFSVGNATSNYAINFSGYSQSSDRVKNNLFPSDYNNMMFTTRDRDNDNSEELNCASDVHTGGWWYNDCAIINLNGNYEGHVTPTATGIYMPSIDTPSYIYLHTKAVKFVEMIIYTRVR